jgi:glycosyltransferase involved in cell wall biosynthesis
MNERLPITLCVSVRNAADQLRECVESCREWVSEVVVVDMESDDDTVDVARTLGARVVEVKKAGFAEPGRQRGIRASTQPWVLVLDGDERVPASMRQVLETFIERSGVAGVRLPRRNFVLGRWLRHSGYWPDYQLRFFRRDSAHWAPYVHTQVEVDGTVATAAASADQAILHRTGRDVRDWVGMVNVYTDLEVARYAALKRGPSLMRLVLLPPFRFFQTYVVRRGFLDGAQGFAVALLAAFYAAVLELKMWERRFEWAP